LEIIPLSTAFPQRLAAMSTPTSSNPDADHNLLFRVLALRSI
jgi:hypothetical protein